MRLMLIAFGCVVLFAVMLLAVNALWDDAPRGLMAFAAYGFFGSIVLIALIAMRNARS